MAAKPQIAVVGPGSLGSALAVSLRRAGYRISEVISRESAASRRKARALARKTGARAAIPGEALLDASVVWLCVPDREIGQAGRSLARRTDWKGKIALHSSGALTSGELAMLRRRGAAVASVHPMMTFVRGSVPALKGVSFAVEGDAAAVRVARRTVRDLGGDSFSISGNRKAAYHAWGTFASPLVVALLAMTERVAGAAGLLPAAARKRSLPILRQTIRNYAQYGAAGAFSGPLVRGDTATVRKHLRVLGKMPEATQVYLALARAALRELPVRNRKLLEKTLQKKH